MISVESTLSIYEVDGEKYTRVPFPHLIVRSHRTASEYMVIEQVNGTTITVAAADLRAAINNATHTKS